MSRTTVIAVASLVVAALACCEAAAPQTKGTPDVSPKRANAVPPLPPTEVVVKKTGGASVVSWRPSPLQIVSGYKIYRKSGSSDFKEIGIVKAPPFVDNESSDAASYAVKAMTVYKTESRLSKPAATVSSKESPSR